MAHLALYLLGPFRAVVDGQPARGFSSAKVRALLAYLAVESDRPHPRETLAGLLWPDWPDRHAYGNLRHAISNLRQCIGDNNAPTPFVVASREAVRCNRAADVDVDVLAFPQHVAAAHVLPTEQAIARLESAVALYRGPFLEGLVLADSGPYEQWLTLQREHWQREMLAALGQLADLYEGQGQYSQAQGCARRALALEPTDERWHRQLMRALALGGERNAALAQYESCQRVLREELGVEPAAETTALCEAIRQGTLGSPPQ